MTSSATQVAALAALYSVKADRESPVAANVSEFLSRAGDLLAPILADHWAQDVFKDIYDTEIKSPIEHLFYIALMAQCRAQCIKVVRERPDPATVRGLVCVEAQKQVGKFRVDFVVSQHRIGPDDCCGPVVVELDGHAFHDKDKHQRAYEKGRDRFLVRSGFRVLHFTGAEVCADPFRVSFEVLSMLGAFAGEPEDFDPAMPLGEE